MEKAQSAMEYLTTYGWAILIIAVVLVVLFQLGVFNPTNFLAKSQPGACQVQRPQGPGTNQYLTLEGTCSGELPEYVAQFNGQNSNTLISNNPLITGNQITIVLWADKLGPGNQNPRGIMAGQGNSYIDTCYLSHPLFTLHNSVTQTLTQGGNCPAVGQWVQYIGTYNGVTTSLYLNGVLVGTNAITGNLHSGIVDIGQYAGGSYNFNGLISNVQIYNTSLSANDISALYLEGIGGAPINLRNLVGWWALNGNANDYSGNLNNGVPTNVIYSGSWESGYTAP